MRGAAKRRLPVGEGMPAQERYRAALTLRLLIVAALALALVAAAASGRAGTALLLAANSGSAASASGTVSATAIAAGLGFTCALTRTGGVKCWGENGHDELGNGRGDSLDSSKPVDVLGLSSQVTAIAAGVQHSCALTSAGGVKCWGRGDFGQLGDGAARRRFAPVDVSGLSGGVTAIAVGWDHSCALTSTDGVKCWGRNHLGQLGDGTTSDRSAPVDVSGLSGGVTAITAESLHTCALTSTGGVKCWGANRSSTPVDVPGLGNRMTEIAAGGGHACALTSAGGVKCWGRNDHGQLGDGTTSDRLTPVDVSGLGGGVTAIAAGTGHSCALTSTGGAKCWGLNDFGQLGDGTTGNRSTPVAVTGLSSGVTAIAPGSFHTCALTRTGGVKCWGMNFTGQLGDGTTLHRRTPVAVVGFGAAKATLALVSRSVTVTPARVAAVELRCGPQARCQGTLTLTASVSGKLVSSSARHVQRKSRQPHLLDCCRPQANGQSQTHSPRLQAARPREAAADTGPDQLRATGRGDHDGDPHDHAHRAC